jgi:hypothetical protein
MWRKLTEHGVPGGRQVAKQGTQPCRQKKLRKRDEEARAVTWDRDLAPCPVSRPEPVFRPRCPNYRGGQVPKRKLSTQTSPAQRAWATDSGIQGGGEVPSVWKTAGQGVQADTDVQTASWFCWSAYWD